MSATLHTNGHLNTMGLPVVEYAHIEQAAMTAAQINHLAGLGRQQADQSLCRQCVGQIQRDPALIGAPVNQQQQHERGKVPARCYFQPPGEDHCRQKDAMYRQPPFRCAQSVTDHGGTDTLQRCGGQWHFTQGRSYPVHQRSNDNAGDDLGK